MKCTGSRLTHRLNSGRRRWSVHGHSSRCGVDEAYLRETIARRLNGRRLKVQAGDIDGICGKLLSDVDASILEFVAKEQMQRELDTGSKFLYAETGSFLCASFSWQACCPMMRLSMPMTYGSIAGVERR